jgi:hypothetical protein
VGEHVQNRRIILVVAAAVLVAVASGFFFVKHLVRLNTGGSPRMVIVMQLRQIDAAKQRYAVEKAASAETIPTREQLEPYLPGFSWEPGLEYHIRSMYELPEVRLTRSFGQLAAGTIIRLTPGALGYETIPPPAEATNAPAAQ